MDQAVGNVGVFSLLDGVTAEAVIASYPENPAFIDSYGIEYGVSLTTEESLQHILTGVYAVYAFKIVQVGDRAFALYRQHGTNNLFSVFIQ